MNFIVFCEWCKFSRRSDYKIVRIISHYIYVLVSFLENVYIHKVPLNRLVLNNKPRKERIIVSLTTYPDRNDAVFYAIKSLFLQTYKPDRIILWLAKSQYTEGGIPEKLERLSERGLEIRFCKDLKSHKKYFYMLQEQKADEVVITFDDDIIHSSDSIQRLMQKHQEFPHAIVSNQAKVIKYDSVKDEVLSYDLWIPVGCAHNYPRLDCSVMSGSGCLYPYNVMPKETFDWNLIHQYALSTDDLWITATSNSVGICVVSPDKVAKNFTIVSDSQKTHLGLLNCINHNNDVSFKKLLQLFPIIKQHIRESSLHSTMGRK